jgi:hypothetical protein
VSFALGLNSFFKAFVDVLSIPSLRAWYLRSVFKTFVVALIVFLILLGMGVLGFWSYLDQHWMSGVGIFLWVIILSFFSGTITFSIMNLAVALLFDEQSLLKSLGKQIHSKKIPWKLRRLEFSRAFVTLLVALCCWPLLFLVIGVPFALFFLAWAMGREALVGGLKIQALERGEANQKILTQNGITSLGMGISVIPALGMLFPILGWSTFPILNLAAFYALSEAADSN